MLQVHNMNYNASASSLGANDEAVANFNFSADNYGNFSFNINYLTKAAITSADVMSDFAAFKTQVAAIIEDDF